MVRQQSYAGPFLALLLISLVAVPTARGAGPIQNFAIVQDDASLLVQGRRIYLFGIHVPRTGRGCDQRFSPVRCGSRAARALDAKIQGFVTCYPKARYQNRSLAAVCYVDEGAVGDPPLDLGAWLIEQGLAVASPEAPFAYVTLERIALANRRGIWGLEID
jgi:endonuclease YncB( thermonuclease family)